MKTRSFEGYGKLSHQSIDELRSGARIQVGEKKEDAARFRTMESGERKRNLLG